MRAGIIVLALALAACGGSVATPSEQPSPTPGYLLPGQAAVTPCEKAVVAMWALPLYDAAYRAAYDTVFATCTDAELVAMNDKTDGGWGFKVDGNGQTYYTRQECRSPGNHDTKLCQSVP